MHGPLQVRGHVSRIPLYTHDRCPLEDVCQQNKTHEKQFSWIFWFWGDTCGSADLNIWMPYTITLRAKTFSGKSMSEQTFRILHMKEFYICVLAPFWHKLFCFDAVLDFAVDFYMLKVEGDSLTLWKFQWLFYQFEQTPPPNTPPPP